MVSLFTVGSNQINELLQFNAKYMYNCTRNIAYVHMCMHGDHLHVYAYINCIHVGYNL